MPRLLAVILLAILAAPAYGNSPVTPPQGTAKPLSERDQLRAEMKAEAESLRADMEGEVERLQVRVDQFMEVQDKRIGDVSLYTNWNNGLIALLGVIVTLATVGAAFKFANAAQEEAKSAVREWLNENALMELSAFKDDLAKRGGEALREALKSIDDKAAPILAKIEQDGRKVIEGVRNSFEGLNRHGGAINVDTGGSDHVSSIVKDPKRFRPAAAQALRKLPDERTFDDWYILAWLADEEGEAEAALKRFENALKQGSDDTLVEAKASYQVARKLANLGRVDDAIARADGWREKYGDSEQEEFESLHIACFYLKGTLFIENARYSEAVEAFNQACARVWSEDNEDVALRMSALRINFGYALQKVDQPEEARYQYDRVILGQSGAKRKEIRAQVALAHYNKALLLDRQEKEDELLKLVERFSDLEDPKVVDAVERARRVLRSAKRSPRAPAN